MVRWIEMHSRCARLDTDEVKSSRVCPIASEQ